MGPLMISMALFPPLRPLTYGWLLSVWEVGLWGIGMKILIAVMLDSNLGILLDPARGEAGIGVGAVVINLIFLVFSLVSPFFIHAVVSGGLASVSVIGPGIKAGAKLI